MTLPISVPCASFTVGPALASIVELEVKLRRRSAEDVLSTGDGFKTPNVKNTIKVKHIRSFGRRKEGIKESRTLESVILGQPRPTAEADGLEKREKA